MTAFQASETWPAVPVAVNPDGAERVVVLVVLSVVLVSSSVVVLVSSLVVDAPSSLLLAQEMIVRLKMNIRIIYKTNC